jgi:hypothetical protein
MVVQAPSGWVLREPKALFFYGKGHWRSLGAAPGFVFRFLAIG